METEKLYWNDAFATRFEAGRAEAARFGDKPSVVLDRTLFYPEAGGQLGDRGTLRLGDHVAQVIDTQIDDAGLIHHVLAEALPSCDGPVTGEIDARARASQRLQHTAQHMLSSALAQVAQGPTVSARLGTKSSTIDIGLDKIAEGDVDRAEDLVNAVVRDDVVVRASFPTPEMLARLPLRRRPKVTDKIRIVIVGDEAAPFDVTPCGGTHVARTGQIGGVRVTGVERYKGMTRITFLAGEHMLEDARIKDRTLALVARDFTCGALDVPNALAKLRADLKAERDVATKLRQELVTLQAERLLAATPPRAPFSLVTFVVEEGDVGQLRALAGQLTKRADVLAVLAANTPAGASLVVQRGAAVDVDCGALLRKMLGPLGGKGGGSRERAEGKALASVDGAAALERVAKLDDDP